jgi:hypothetical protein
MLAVKSSNNSIKSPTAVNVHTPYLAEEHRVHVTDHTCGQAVELSLQTRKF